jgi:spermidine synthase
MSGLVFGATTLAISAVLTAFMAGLALGSAIAARTAPRLTRPIFVYGAIEIVVGLYALAVPRLFYVIDWGYAGIWRHWQASFYALTVSRFGFAALILLVPTILMGATLPVLAAAVERSSLRHSNAVTRLYAGNLMGAIIGTIAAGFFLLPSLGVTKTIWLAAGINLVIGCAALLADRARDEIAADFEATTDQHWFSLREWHGRPARESRARCACPNQTEPARTDGVASVKITGATFWLFGAFVSGLVTIGMQIVWSRLLAMIVGSSTYAFSIVLALFLGGLTLGAFIVSRMTLRELASLRRTIFWIEILTAAGLFVSVSAINIAPELLIQAGFRFGIANWAGLLGLQIGVAAMVILVPVLLMGMVLPLVLLSAQSVTARESDYASPEHESASVRFVGHSYALNTIGAIAGSLVTAFVFIPKFGSRLTIFAFASACLVVAGVAYEPRRDSADRAIGRSLAAGIAAMLIIAMFASWPRLRIDRLSVGAYDSFVRVLANARGGIPDNDENRASGDHQLLMFDEGRTSTVSVRRDWNILSLAINGRTNASDSEDMPTQIMLGQIGVLLAPQLKNALVVGFATGVTVGSLLQSPIQSVACVEIEPAAVTASHYFEHVNQHPLGDSRTHVIIDDARTYLKVNAADYDLIVSEPSHPWVSGVANLFTREFFALGRDRLRGDGVFVQWLQTYQLSTESLRSILATFHEVFPHMLIFRVQDPAKGKDLILVGSRSPLDSNRIPERLGDDRIVRELGRAGIRGASDLQSNWFVCDEMRLVPALVGAQINSDDNMLVETRAPRDAFRPTLQDNAAWIEALRKSERAF